MVNFNVEGYSPQIEALIERQERLEGELEDLQIRVAALEDGQGPPDPPPPWIPPLEVNWILRDYPYGANTHVDNGGAAQTLPDPSIDGGRMVYFRGHRGEYWHADHVYRNPDRSWPRIAHAVGHELKVDQDWLIETSTNPWFIWSQVHNVKGSPAYSLQPEAGTRDLTLVDHTDGRNFIVRARIPLAEFRSDWFQFSYVGIWDQEPGGRFAAYLNGEVWWDSLAHFGRLVPTVKPDTSEATHNAVYTKDGDYDGRGGRGQRFGRNLMVAKYPNWDDRLHEMVEAYRYRGQAA